MMEAIIGDRYGTKRNNLTRVEAKSCGETLRQHAVTVTAVVEPGGYVLRATFADRTIRYFRTVEDVQELTEQASVAWMLKNGPRIMLGRE
jgi:hypothetical protein